LVKRGQCRLADSIQGVPAFAGMTGGRRVQLDSVEGAAVDGQGGALGDSSLVSDDLAAGRLVQPFALTIKGPAQFAYYVISRMETQNDPLIRSFREWILDEAARTPLVK
jgi:DNA-binding transcriptional LysR family regulator